MALPVWRPVQSLAMPNVNPNAALNSAVNAFGNISDTIRQNRSADAEAEYRAGLLQQKADELEFERGEDDRAKQRVADMASAFDSAYSTGRTSQLENFRISDDNVAALANELGVPLEEARSRSRALLDQNPELIYDPYQLQGDVRANLARQGYVGEEVEALLGNAITRDFGQTLSSDQQKLMIDALGDAITPSDIVGRSRGSRGRAGSDPKEIPVDQARKDFELINAFVDNAGLEEEGILSRFFDVRRPDLFKEDIQNTVNQVKTLSGAQTPFILQAIEGIRQGDTSDFRLGRNMSREDLAELSNAALTLQNQSFSGGSAATGGDSLESALATANQFNTNRNEQVRDIISAGNYKVASSADRLAFLREQFGLTKKQAQKVDKKVQKNTETSGTDSTDKLFNDALSGSPGSSDAAAIADAVVEVKKEEPKKNVRNDAQERIKQLEITISQAGNSRQGQRRVAGERAQLLTISRLLEDMNTRPVKARGRSLGITESRAKQIRDEASEDLIALLSQ